MKQRSINKITILMIILLIFIYGILIPIIPLGKFVLSDINIVRVYPYQFYLLKELPNQEGPDFVSYMKSKGWTYEEDMESTWVYVKGNLKKYINVDQFIRVIIYKSNIEIWQGMTWILNWPRFIFYVVFVIYMLPVSGFTIFIIKRNKKYMKNKYRT